MKTIRGNKALIENLGGGGGYSARAKIMLILVQLVLANRIAEIKGKACVKT